MKLKELKVGCRLSYNYNSFESEVIVTLEDGDDIEQIKKDLFDGCKRDCSKQILIAMREK